jgi:beta-lactamase superfamily II metal-dependent hydrolase
MCNLRKTNLFLILGLIFSAFIGTTLNMKPARAAGTCSITAGQVVINEILPAPSSGNPEWVEFYNTTGSTLDLSNCYIDDIASGGGSPKQIPAGSTIPAHGFWYYEITSAYFNNTGDDVRLLLDDSTTVLDTFTFGATDTDTAWYRFSDGETWASYATSWTTKAATNNPACGSGSWLTGNLEIYHFDVGQGDSTLIVSPTGKTLLFDTSEKNITRQVMGVTSCRKLDYLVISHFHADHTGSVGQKAGLWDLLEVENFTIGKTLLRDYSNYLGNKPGPFTDWKTYIEGDGLTKLNPVTAIEGTSQVDLGGGVTFNILTVDGNGQLKKGDFSADTTPPSENDYSVGALISFGSFDEWLGGDLDGVYYPTTGYAYHDIETSVAHEIGDVDVLRVHHHGSDHSSNQTFIDQLDPEVSIISVGNSNGYGHPTAAVVDRLLATSAVYLTELGELDPSVTGVIVANGSVVVKISDGIHYTVNGNSYTATEPTRIDDDKDGYFKEVDPNDNDSKVIPYLNGGCDSAYQVSCPAEECSLTAGQVLINEILPAPSTGNPEWIELYNTTDSPLHLGYCYLDDMAAGGGSPKQITAGTMILPHNFKVFEFSSYFNNTGDDVRLLKEDETTVLDSRAYGSTGADLAWYRSPNGGPWAAAATTHSTKGASNTYPVVTSITRANPSPSSASSLDFTVTFSEPASGVDASDFTITKIGGLLGEALTGISPSSGLSSSFTITVATTSGSGTLRLNVVDDDTIANIASAPLGGVGVGNGNYTSGEVYTVDRNIPNLVSPTNAAKVLTLQPVFDWDDITGATGYTIQVSRIATFASLVVTGNPTDSTYTPTAALPANITLYWRVRTKSGTTTSSWSEVFSFTTPNPPGVPTLLSPINNALITGFTLTLDWSNSTIPAGTALANYEFQVSRDNAFPTLYDSGSVTASQYSFSMPLDPNTTFFWHVRACNTDGDCSPWSQTRSFRSALSSPILTAPDDAANLLTNRPTFTWNVVNGATGYTLQIGRNLAFSSLVGTYLVTSATYTPTVNLPANITLYWRVQSRGTNGPSAWSATRSINTANPPSIPVLLLPAPNALTTDYTPRLDWTQSTVPAGTTFDHYELWLDKNSDFSSSYMTDIAGLANHEFTLPDPDALNSNATYYWRVRSHNAAGEYGSWSLVRTLRTALPPPHLIVPNDGWDLTTNLPTFEWETVTGATGYTLQIGRNAAFTSLVGSYAPTPASYTLAASLPVNITLYWRVQSRGTNGPSGWSATRSFNTANPPSIPTLLSPALNALITDGPPTLDWANVTLPAGTTFGYYRVQIDNDSDFSSPNYDETTAAGDITASQFESGLLASNNKYYWRVSACNADGEFSSWSTLRDFRMAIFEPTVTSPLHGMVLQDRRPIFEWEDVAGATSYTLQVSKNGTFSQLVVIKTTATSTYSQTTDLLASTTYYWRVRTNAANGPSVWSNTGTFTTGNPPAAPILLAPAINALTTNPRPTFTWKPVVMPVGTTLENYIIQIDNNSDFSSPEIDEMITPPTPTFTPASDLTPNTRFYWKVRAMSTAGDVSNWSIVRYFRTAILPPVLSAPADLDIVPSLRPTFNWGDVTGASGYTIQVSRNNTFTQLVINATVTGGTNSQYTPIISFAVNATFYWRVKANGLNGPSLWSTPIWSFISPNPPGVPVLVAPAVNALLTDYSPTLTWSKPLLSTTPGSAPFDHYQIQIATDAAFTAIVQDADIADYYTPSYTASPDLTPNTRYYWHVRAWDTLGHYSLWSTSRYFRTAITPPVLVFPTDTLTVSLLRPPFNWDDVTGATGYTIQVSRNNTFTLLVVNATVTGLTHSWYTPTVNLPINIPLYWRVRANGINGPSLWSTPIWSFTVTP